MLCGAHLGILIGPFQTAYYCNGKKNAATAQSIVAWHRAWPVSSSTDGDQHTALTYSYVMTSPEPGMSPAGPGEKSTEPDRALHWSPEHELCTSGKHVCIQMRQSGAWVTASAFTGSPNHDLNQRGQHLVTGCAYPRLPS